MQVLVVLARASGAVVSRDSLVQQCWGGRIVGDDSVNRAISRLRRLSVERGENSFQIQTISKVGYRLIGEVSPLPAKGPPGSALGSVPEAPRSVSPRPRRRLLIAACAAAAILAALVFFLHSFGFGVHGHRPVVEVETFRSIAPGLPAGFTAQLRAETADLLANERFYAVSMAQGRTGPKPDWRVTGTITPGDDGREVVVFAQLVRADSDVAVAELRIDRDARQPMLARSLGLRIGRTAGCILLTVTNPDLTGGYVASALPTLAHACLIWHDKTTSPSARMEAFRAAAAALPTSSYFPARMAEMLGDRAADGPPNASDLRREGMQDVEAARRLDPTQPHIFLAEAKLLPPLDLAGREALIRKALAGRPSDCGCELGDYSAFLSRVGRNKEALDYASHAREREPKDILWLRRKGEAAALSGDFESARAILADVAGYLPDPSSLDDWRFNLGLWSRDWPLARAMLALQPDPELRSLQTNLVTALAGGNAGQIQAAALPFERRSQNDTTNDRAGVTALAMSGRVDQALSAVARLLDRRPSSLGILFEPSFSAARRTLAFASLATRLGLVGYWRASKHLPDFCQQASRSPVCRMI